MAPQLQQQPDRWREFCRSGNWYATEVYADK